LKGRIVSEANGASEARDAGGEEAPEAGAPLPLPPASFLTLITELAIQVMMNLGEVANPVTGEARQDLEHAKHTIDLLGVLREKTAGNLDAEEEAALNQYLYDLRMKYVRACGM
jgi:hypothetical protein